MRNLFLAAASLSTLVTGAGFVGVAHAQQANGSFRQSCRNVQVSGGALTAECADISGRYRVSTLPYTQCKGDIGNNNGLLNCNGASATGGAFVQGSTRDDGRRGDGRRGDDRRGGNGGDALAAGALGAVAGALLGGAQSDPYRPGVTYPAYGDTRYGDPRYDPRYGPGGYGEGRQRGQWIPIRDRAEWLDRRIDRGVRQGSLDRREERRLRAELADIEQLERRYERQGLRNSMRADLDHRFDLLAQRIRYERNDDDRRGYR